jgi:hypothetical protein
MVETNLMNTQQAAKYMGFNPGTLTNWRNLKRYDLPFIKIGKRGYVRYRKSDIDSFLERNTERAAS